VRRLAFHPLALCSEERFEAPARHVPRRAHNRVPFHDRQREPHHSRDLRQDPTALQGNFENAFIVFIEILMLKFNPLAGQLVDVELKRRSLDALPVVERRADPG
jgi:hypothetical protein